MSTPGGGNAAGAGSTGNTGSSAAAAGAAAAANAGAAAAAQGAAAAAAKAAASSNAANTKSAAAKSAASGNMGSGAATSAGAAAAAAAAAAKANAVGLGGNQSTTSKSTSSPNAAAAAAANAAGLARAAAAQAAAAKSAANAKAAATAPGLGVGARSGLNTGTSPNAAAAAAANAAKTAGALGGKNATGPNAAAAAAANRMGASTTGPGLAKTAAGLGGPGGPFGAPMGTLGTFGKSLGSGLVSDAAARAKTAEQGVKAGLTNLLGEGAVPQNVARMAGVSAYVGKPTLGFDPAAKIHTPGMNQPSPPHTGVQAGIPSSTVTAPGTALHTDVNAKWGANFQSLLDSLALDPRTKFKSIGGFATRNRPGDTHSSYHPTGQAMDVNQSGYGVISGLPPRSVTDAAAYKAGLVPGSTFHDIGHFEARNPEAAMRAQRAMTAGQILGMDMAAPGAYPPGVKALTPRSTTPSSFTAPTAPRAATTPTAAAASTLLGQEAARMAHARAVSRGPGLGGLAASGAPVAADAAPGQHNPNYTDPGPAVRSVLGDKANLADQMAAGLFSRPKDNAKIRTAAEVQQQQAKIAANQMKSFSTTPTALGSRFAKDPGTLERTVMGENDKYGIPGMRAVAAQMATRQALAETNRHLMDASQYAALDKRNTPFGTQAMARANIAAFQGMSPESNVPTGVRTATHQRGVNETSPGWAARSIASGEFGGPQGYMGHMWGNPNSVNAKGKAIASSPEARAAVADTLAKTFGTTAQTRAPPAAPAARPAAPAAPAAPSANLTEPQHSEFKSLGLPRTGPALAAILGALSPGPHPSLGVAPAAAPGQSGPMPGMGMPPAGMAPAATGLFNDPNWSSHFPAMPSNINQESRFNYSNANFPGGSLNVSPPGYTAPAAPAAPAAPPSTASTGMPQGFGFGTPPAGAYTDPGMQARNPQETNIARNLAAPGLLSPRGSDMISGTGLPAGPPAMAPRGSDMIAGTGLPPAPPAAPAAPVTPTAPGQGLPPGVTVESTPTPYNAPPAEAKVPTQNVDMAAVAEKLAQYGPEFSYTKLQFAKLTGQIPATVKSVTQNKEGGWHVVSKDGTIMDTHPATGSYSITSGPKKSTSFGMTSALGPSAALTGLPSEPARPTPSAPAPAPAPAAPAAPPARPAPSNPAPRGSDMISGTGLPIGAPAAPAPSGPIAGFGPQNNFNFGFSDLGGWKPGQMAPPATSAPPAPPAASPPPGQSGPMPGMGMPPGGQTPPSPAPPAGPSVAAPPSGPALGPQASVGAGMPSGMVGANPRGMDQPPQASAPTQAFMGVPSPDSSSSSAPIDAATARSMLTGLGLNISGLSDAAVQIVLQKILSGEVKLPATTPTTTGTPPA